MFKTTTTILTAIACSIALSAMPAEAKKGGAHATKTAKAPHVKAPKAPKGK